MGQIRSIQHPGCEIFEIDASGSTEQVGGCTTLVAGFFPQGKSLTPFNPTTMKSVRSYFGTPENEAERYSYYACKTVFDNGGNLITARIPYDNNSQYLAPAVKYKIEEWSTSHVTPYTENNSVSLNRYKSYNHYSMTTLTEDTEIKKSSFFKTASINPSITEVSNVADYMESDGETTTPKTRTELSINGSTASTNTDYFKLSFDSTKWFDTTKTATVTADSEPVSYEVTSYVSGFVGNFDSTGVSGEFSEITLNMTSETFISLSNKKFTTTDNEATLGEVGGLKGKIVAEKNSAETALNGIFKVYQWNETRTEYENTPSLVLDNLIYQNKTISTDLAFNPLAFCTGYSDRFSIVRYKNEGTYDAGTVTTTTTAGFYTETRKVEDKSDFYYDVSTSLPITSTVKKLTADASGKDVMVITKYLKSGEGAKSVVNTPDKFLELRIWDKTEIPALSALTSEKAAYFDVIENTYVGQKQSEYTKITQSGFKSAAISADVTTGYKKSDGSITSDLMSIPEQKTLDPSKLPEISEVDDPNGNGKIKVLSKTNMKNDVAFDKNDYYRFVSLYRTIEDVALAGSNNYQWIHYTTNTTLEAQGDYKNSILMSSTLGCETSAVPEGLSKIENVVSIIPDEENKGYIPLSEYLDYRDEAKIADENTIVIANVTEQRFGKDPYNNVNDEIANGEEVLGIVPVLMTGFQALPKQSRIEIPGSITNAKIFNALETMVRGSSIEQFEGEEKNHVDVASVVLNKDGFVKKLSSESYDPYESTHSNDMLAKVPSIELNSNYKPNGAKTNYVTLVICKLSISSINDNRVALTVYETFNGSLDRNAKDEAGNSIFIDDIVNNLESGSTYVSMYSNYNTKLTGSSTRTIYNKTVVNPASNDTKVTVVTPKSCGVEKWWSYDKKAFSVGFVEEQTKKYISYATLFASIDNIFDILSNVDELDIDIVVDAGLSSIANRLKRYIDANPTKTKCEYDLTFDQINSVSDVAGWKSMAARLVTFCQSTRKDCLSLIDSPRSICVKNNTKLLECKKTTSSKYTIDYDILPKFNYIGGLNSSYGAGFCNWLMAVDDFTGKNVWMPPSIAAEGSVIYTDYGSNYWMAPAGENRGTINWAVDVAFNPNGSQQDSIYAKCWNYAVNSNGTIMNWGQKTFLTSNSSFNRINVRRLFLKLERMVRKNSKWVIFELNNQKTRNTYHDRIDPIFANVKALGGIEDYKIIVDERVNTPTVRMANEFRSVFMIKPSMCAEYLILSFFNVGLTSEFSEFYGDL